MSKSKSFISILIPSATVFLSSGCIMVLELVAGRLIARHLGSSLYTWTSVIGVVLAGITIGNYLGGRIADRFPARKALAVLFVICSATCVGIVVFNNIVGEWIWLWRLNWPLRVFSHVAMVFLVPSALLGTISPVVAKMALDQGLPTGRTVGDIYAWGAAGSIVGTFLTGFYLIAAMGTIAIIWSVGAVLLLMAILYWTRLWVSHVWAVTFVALMTMGMAPINWARHAGTALALRIQPDPDVIYEDESQYCHISIKRVSQATDRRAFMQDKLKHSEIIMTDTDNLLYFHTVVFAAITHGLSQNKEKFSAMHIGGGGYVFPQYIEKNWPGNRNDVAEIDLGVTEAAMQAFGLNKNTTVNTFTMDARNYVDKLLMQERNGMPITRYDFIFEDAFSDYSVPYQLVTKEFNDKIFKILTDDGVYMINSIEIYDSGLFLGAYVNTLKQTFPYVYVITERTSLSNRNLFVVIASKKQLDAQKFVGQYRKDLDIWYLDDNEINALIQKSGALVLTDNYVPVENLLAPVVRRSSIDLLSGTYRSQAAELKRQGKLDESIAKYKELINLDPRMAPLACNEIGMIRAQQGRSNEALEAFRQAIEENEKLESKTNVANIHFNLGMLLKKLGQSKESQEHFAKAIEGFREELTKNPGSLAALPQLGDALAEIGRFNEAARVFEQVAQLDPYNTENSYKLAQALAIQGRYDEAVVALKKAAAFMIHIGNKEAAARLHQEIDLLELRKSKHNN